MALLQTKFRGKRVTVQHIVQKYGHNVGYLPKEPICTPQLIARYTTPSMGSSDSIQSQNSGRVLYVGTIPREHKPEERAIKWVKTKRVA